MSRLQEELDALGLSLPADLLEMAMTHRSWAYENGGAPNNERLEFLGDSVLGVVVTEHLFRTFPNEPEGQLARLRAVVVSGHSLAQLARNLEIGSLIKLGRGEVTTGGSDKDSILADTVEAIIGAVFLAGGYEAAVRLVHRWTDPLVDQAASLGAGLDWKSSLQELTASQGLGAPVYESVAEGPDHERVYTASVIVDKRTFGTGQASSKRHAEQQAAAIAYAQLNEEMHTELL